MRCCARFRRAPATIFIARVIFCVDLTVTMRLRIDLSDGIRQPLLFEADLPSPDLLFARPGLLFAGGGTSPASADAAGRAAAPSSRENVLRNASSAFFSSPV